MNKKIFKIIEYFFTEEQKHSLEHRLFLSSLKLGILIGTLATFISIGVDATLPSIFICAILTSIVTIVYYFGRYKGIIDPFILPIVLFIYFGIFFVWLLAGGIDNQNMVPALVVFITSLFMIQPKYKRLILITFLILISLVYIIQLKFPELIIPFPSEESRWIDGISTSLYSAICAYLLAKLIHNNYNLEKNKAEENEMKFKAIIEQSNEAIVVSDLNGKFIIVNSTLCRMSGYTEQELLQNNTFEVHQQFLNIPELDETNKNITRQTCLKRKDGSQINIEIVVNRISINNNQYILGSARDITERVKAEKTINDQNARLSELIAEKDRFFSILGHDLRSPFSTILGFSELLSKNVRKNDIEKTEKQLSIINNTVKETYNLLEDILLWSKIKSGKHIAANQKYSISNICYETVSSLNELLNKKGITVNISIPPELFGLGDVFSIKTILRNIISNAIKYSFENSSIEITSQREASQIIIKITDYGIGMDEAKITEILENKQVVSIAGTNKESGTGFGLSLCMELIHINHGTISIYSEIHKGSSFVVSLPIA